jgi:hypothetical protein
MKRVLFRTFMVGVVLFVLGALCLGPRSLRAEQKKDEKKQEVTDESSFWDMFRKAFSRPEPSYKRPSGNLTKVAGVRGVDREGALGQQEDWESVSWMEKYTLNESDVRQFLESRKIGPFKPGGGE